MRPVPDTDAEIAIRAAEAASEVIRSAFGGPLTHYAKDADDFATQADLTAEQTILAIIGSARPADLFLAEESGSTGTSGSERTWLIDPLCGTRNFAAGVPQVAVNIALRTAGQITVAAVADPFAAEVFWTSGQGAFVRHGGTDRPLSPKSGTRLVDLDLDPPSPNRDWFRPARLLDDELFTTAFHPRVLSTSLALAWVAAGRRAAYLTDGDMTDNVHFTAGIALCRAAGCAVSGLSGRPVESAPHGLLAAADPDTHARLLERIAAQREPA